MQKLFTLLFLTLLSHFSFAQPGRAWDRPMELKKCSVSIKADLFTATTFIQMEFFNPNAQEIEGLYRFNLQPGQAITAFQLDLSGKFRDGSIEEKWKARNAYNTIVGKRVDPALLQMDGYNSYSLRIYPVPAKGTRRITLTIQQLLKVANDTLNYLLPITSADKLERFEVEATTHPAAAKAFAKEGLLKGESFVAGPVSQQLKFTAADFVWKESISFSLALPAKDAVCVKGEGDKTFFAVLHTASVPKAYSLRPKSIAVFWDASFSGRKRDTEKEIAFLKQYLAYYGINELVITPFNYKTGNAVRFRLKEKEANWQTYLRSLAYEGATQLSALDFDATEADAVFLISDGYNSFGSDLPQAKKKPVFCIHAASLADNATLNNIVGNSGGRNIDLQKMSISEAIALAGSVENRLLAVRSASGKTIIDAEEYNGKTNFSFLAGTTTAVVDTLLFKYGNALGTPLFEKVVLQPSSACEGSALNRLPALARFDDLLRKASWQDLLYFGKDEKMVTYHTSYIVLEKAADYVKFNIEPPKDLEEECNGLQPGINVRNNRDEKMRQRKWLSEYEILSGVAAQYNGRIRSWGGDELIALKPPKATTENGIAATTDAAKGAPGASTALAGTVAGLSGAAELSEVVVIGYGTMRRRELTGSVTTVRAAEISAGATTVEQTLSGRVAGLVVTSNNNGWQSSPSSIHIRGVSSLGNNSPLFVLDGVPISGDADGQTNINSFVNVSDIETISVLKDASATALYGSRGANGVIVIQTKKGSRNYWNYNPGPYKLKSMEDVAYLQEIKEASKEEKLAKYKELQPLHEGEAGFYLDMAQHLYESGWKKKAMVILTTAAEVLPNNIGMQKTVAHFLAQWGEWQEAIRWYEPILKAAPAPLAYRDLAVAYAQNNQHQKAVNLLYEAIRLDYGDFETVYAPQKSLLLNDLNAMIAMRKDSLDLSVVPKELLKPLPVDLRIVIECIGGNVYGATVAEPNGKLCRDQSYASDGKGRFSQNFYDNGTKEYQLKEAVPGRYKVRVNYYDYYSNSAKQPGVIRLTVYRNFGKPNQTLSVENIMMDNQFSEVEIAEVKF